MDKYSRVYTKLSLCGLNCGLCPMYHIKSETGCPGCGGPSHQACSFKKCASQHGGVQYCYECEEYPCAKFEGFADFDSFISHKNVFINFEKIQADGLEAYQAELDKKVEIITELQEGYNDGRRKTFYCQAVNLLELNDVVAVMERIRATINPTDSLKERATIAVMLFQKMADIRDITLKLHRKK